LDFHPNFDGVFVVTIELAHSLDPSHEGALSAIALQFASAGVGAWGYQQQVDFVDELFATVAVGVVMVENGLEKRVALAVKKTAGDGLIASDESLCHSQVFCIYPLYFHYDFLFPRQIYIFNSQF
jgi:hypothetical protein